MTIDLAAMGAVTDDLVLVYYGRASNTSRTPVIVQTGYTNIVSLFANSSHDTNLHVYHKFMGGTPDTEVQITVGSTSSSDGEYMIVEVWRGVNLAAPLDVVDPGAAAVARTATGTNSRLANPPTLTPTTVGAKIIVVGACSSNNLAAATLAIGYGNSELALSNNGSTYDLSIAVADIDWVSGAYDPAAFTTADSATGNTWAAAAFALRFAP